MTSSEGAEAAAGPPVQSWPPMKMAPTKRQAYEAQFKLQVIGYAEEHGNRGSAREFNVNESMVRKWRKQVDQLRRAKKTKLSFRGNKARWPKLEEQLEQWVQDQREAGERVSTVTIRLRARTLAEQLKIQHFQGGPSWCFRFMKRRHLLGRPRTSAAQQKENSPKLAAVVCCSRNRSQRFADKRVNSDTDEVPLTSASVAKAKANHTGDTSTIKSEPEMNSPLQIGFLGAGNMAFGIAKGILAGNVLPTNVKVSAPSDRNLARFRELNICTSHSNAEVACNSDVIFVAVKPHLVAAVLNEISQHLTDRHVVVSLAAGVTLATLEELLPAGSCVIRLMPNLACTVVQGALLFTRGSRAKQEHAALVCSLLQRCGLVHEGPEAWIDIHTGLSGSGLAFVYLFAEALAEGAVKMGMPGALAQRIASQTILGAGHLLLESNKHPAELRSEVCTPGGTTIYGLHALEQGGVRASTMAAVEAATERARELGRKSAAPASMK